MSVRGVRDLAIGAVFALSAWGGSVFAGELLSAESDSTRAAFSRQTFEQLKGLSGRWVGQSTKGWTDTITYKTVAGGSVVVEESFGAHPGETMYCMFHLHGGRLLLTHYCVAKNQPRLEATEFEDGGKVVTFTFLDATGMTSRNQGHMDKCRMTFAGPDSLIVHWTWYQEGKESWMEEIHHKRVP
jgi:hypothetical protein